MAGSGASGRSVMDGRATANRIGTSSAINLSRIIHASRIGMCATVACISHFARTLVRERLAQSDT